MENFTGTKPMAERHAFDPGALERYLAAALPGFAGHYVAMQPVLDAAMDLMAARLRGGLGQLPPSQVVRQEILAAPGADAIITAGRELRIPK